MSAVSGYSVSDIRYVTEILGAKQRTTELMNGLFAGYCFRRFNGLAIKRGFHLSCVPVVPLASSKYVTNFATATPQDLCLHLANDCNVFYNTIMRASKKALVGISNGDLCDAIDGLSGNNNPLLVQLANSDNADLSIAICLQIHKTFCASQNGKARDAGVQPIAIPTTTTIGGIVAHTFLYVYPVPAEFVDSVAGIVPFPYTVDQCDVLTFTVPSEQAFSWVRKGKFNAQSSVSPSKHTSVIISQDYPEHGIGPSSPGECKAGDFILHSPAYSPTEMATPPPSVFTKHFKSVGFLYPDQGNGLGSISRPPPIDTKFEDVSVNPCSPVPVQPVASSSSSCSVSSSSSSSSSSASSSSSSSLGSTTSGPKKGFGIPSAPDLTPRSASPVPVSPSFIHVDRDYSISQRPKTSSHKKQRMSTEDAEACDRFNDLEHKINLNFGPSVPGSVPALKVRFFGYTMFRTELLFAETLRVPKNCIRLLPDGLEVNFENHRDRMCTDFVCEGRPYDVVDHLLDPVHFERPFSNTSDQTLNFFLHPHQRIDPTVTSMATLLSETIGSLHLRLHTYFRFSGPMNDDFPFYTLVGGSAPVTHFKPNKKDDLYILCPRADISYHEYEEKGRAVTISRNGCFTHYQVDESRTRACTYDLLLGHTPHLGGFYNYTVVAQNSMFAMYKAVWSETAVDQITATDSSAGYFNLCIKSDVINDVAQIADDFSTLTLFPKIEGRPIVVSLPVYRTAVRYMSGRSRDEATRQALMATLRTFCVADKIDQTLQEASLTYVPAIAFARNLQTEQTLMHSVNQFLSSTFYAGPVIDFHDKTSSKVSQYITASISKDFFRQSQFLLFLPLVCLILYQHATRINEYFNPSSYWVQGKYFPIFFHSSFGINIKLYEQYMPWGDWIGFLRIHLIKTFINPSYTTIYDVRVYAIPSYWQHISFALEELVYFKFSSLRFSVTIVEICFHLFHLNFASMYTVGFIYLLSLYGYKRAVVTHLIVNVFSYSPASLLSLSSLFMLPLTGYIIGSSQSMSTDILPGLSCPWFVSGDKRGMEVCGPLNFRLLPVLPNGSSHNILTSVTKRFLLELPPIDLHWRRSKNEASFKFGCGVTWFDWLPTPFPVWLSRYPLNQQAYLVKCRSQLPEIDLKTAAKRHDVFVKREKLMKIVDSAEDNWVARTILPCSPHYNVAIGPWFHSLASNLKKHCTPAHFCTWGAGVTANVVGDWMACVFKAFPNPLFHFGDYTKFDAHVRHQHNLHKIWLYATMGFPSKLVQVMIGESSSSTISHQKGFRASFRGRTVTGRQDTTVGNTLINMENLCNTALCTFGPAKYLDTIEGRECHFKFICAGDDFVMVTNGVPLPLQNFENSGFSVKIHMTPYYWDGDFCSGLFYPHGDTYILGPKIGKILSKIFVNVEDPMPMLQYQKTIANSLFPMCSHIPFLSNLLRRMMDHPVSLGKIKAKLHHHASSAIVRPDPKALVFLINRYHIDISALSHLFELINAQLLNRVAISDPVFDLVSLVDN
jgi:hypothetical protein